ncbi:MAG: 3-methyl-2-oxobutanoate hydroxymethyltransferase, partial [Armatimonadota bacterium]|nr:3-methyl-2-oxobutanoate hydroxymethyltransferase [Armatimonadota bacterium]
MNESKVTTQTLIKMKRAGEKITCLTAYDFSMAKLMDAAGVDIILVGDSLGQVVLGYETTIPVTMEEMLHRVKAVVRGVSRAMVVADMPFMSFQVSPEEALKNAARFAKEAGAIPTRVEAGKPVTEALTLAVKLEGASPIVIDGVKRIVDAGIPVMGHLGMLPMSAAIFGGPRVHGRTEEEAERIMRDAIALQEAGVFAVVLEKVPR